MFSNTEIDNSDWRIQDNYKEQIIECKKNDDWKLIEWKSERLTEMLSWLKRCRSVWTSHSVYICK